VTQEGNMNNYPRSVPYCPQCEVQSGLEQCVICGRNYILAGKRDAARAAKKEEDRLISLTPLFLNGGIDVSYRNEYGHPVSLIKINYDMTGSKKWKKLFRAVRALEDKDFKGVDEIIEKIRKQRYCHRNRPKHWTDFVSKDIQIWAHTIINIEVNDPCISNVRCAKKSDRAAMRLYNKQRKEGCCGCFDIVRRCPFDWLKRYAIGCNYGH
jgi:hypothetical protein